jgi:anaerobic ribonucleoside-triphosphate reductase/anaerobic ribonucleoside-triphosphate reductase activating protein
MFETIQKRDGRVQEFDSSHITRAITKAGEATDEFGPREARKLTLRVLTLAHELRLGPQPTVEAIQDIVERVLLDSPFYRSAKAYILYREQHAQLRQMATQANVDLVEHYIGKLDWKVKENSNMSYSLQGLNNYISSDVTTEYWLNRIYPPEIRQAHRAGDMHIHDLSLLSVYCVGWDLKDLLLQGFRGVAGKVESAPPRHLRSALGQVVNFFYTLQGEAAGAQALSNFDTLLAPFVRYDGLDYRSVKQALQEFVFNINIPTRVGFQTPFTNITMDLYVPSTLKDHPVIIGGELLDATYAEFQTEMNLINRAFADVMMAGDARGRVFTFPIPTYNITEEFDWDNPDLEPIWKMTGKYGIPYFSNFVNSDMSPDDARSMCCRLRLDNRELWKRGGGLFGANPLTGSIGVVTINLPRIGYQAGDETQFFDLLDRQVSLARDSLVIKRKVLEQFTEKNLYPYTKFYLRDIKAGSGLFWKNHFATIGIVGMNEACLNFLGDDIGSPTGRDFAIRVMDHLREAMADLQEETGDLFNLEATPAEGTSYRLCRLDKKKFPAIRCANEDDYRKGAAPYYTNSTQLPVNYTDDLFDTLIHQDDLQIKYTGGTVQHLFLGEMVDDCDTVKNLVRKVSGQFRLPYFTLTPTFSVCPSHGYLKGEQPECPECRQATEVYSRIVGYLRPVKQWNDGKQAEYKNRRPFDWTPASAFRKTIRKPVPTGHHHPATDEGNRFIGEALRHGSHWRVAKSFHDRLSGRLSAVVFLSGCNFHCPYCHNPELARRDSDQSVPESDVLAYLKARRGLLDGVVLTGGEPTLQKGLPDLCRAVQALGYTVKLDTNGSAPEVLQTLIRENLIDYVAMDVKTDPDHYAPSLCRQNPAAAIKASIQLIMASGLPYEFRTTCFRPLVNAETMASIGGLIKGAETYAIQKFCAKETLDPDAGSSRDHIFDDNELLGLKAIVEPMVECCFVR